MTGWRAGYGIMPAEMANHLGRIETNINSCTTSFIQRACIEALKGPQDEAERMAKEFQKRRDVIVDGLNSIKGLSCKRPLGAFYVFPSIKKTGYDCKELADKLMTEAGVACLSGTCFGEYGKGYIRFSYAASIENLKEAINRVKRYVEK
jgi:aspartate/methionine/tyrosine aminotransferase